MRRSRLAKLMMLMGRSLGPEVDYLFDQGSLASYTLVDDTPTIRINPLLDIVYVGNKTQWWAIRSRHWAGKTPVFVFDKATVWFALSSGMWIGAWATSADTDTWHPFDNVTIGATDINLSNNAAFPGGTIYVALWPMYPFSRTQRLMGAWSANSLVDETASTTNKIISLSPANTPDSLGRSSVNLPYYAFKIANATANTKNKAILSSRQHACEGIGGWAFEGAIDWLLTTSPEQKFLLDWFEFNCYPCLYPENLVSGHSRMDWDDYATDINQKWSTTGDVPSVDEFKTAMAVDTDGAIEVGLDYHAYGSTGVALGDVENSADAMTVEFRDQLKTFDAAFSLIEETLLGGLTHWWLNTLSAKLALYTEHGLSTTKTIADWKAYGANTMRTLSKMLARGKFTNGPGVGSRDFAGATSRIDWASPWTPSGAMTLSMWLSADRVNTSQGLWAVEKTGGGFDGIYFWLNGAVGAGRLTFYIEGGTDGYRSSANGVVPGDGTWHNYIVTWDGVVNPITGVHIYKNNAEVASYAAAQNGATPNAFAGDWSLGGFKSVDNYNIDGRMAQVAVWNRVVTATERANLAAGYAPNLAAPSGLQFYFKGNTADLSNEIGGADGTADGTTQLTGAGTGPGIIYG
jgi:hypothetical protein